MPSSDVFGSPVIDATDVEWRARMFGVYGYLLHPRSTSMKSVGGLVCLLIGHHIFPCTNPLAGPVLHSFITQRDVFKSGRSSCICSLDAGGREAGLLLKEKDWGPG